MCQLRRVWRLQPFGVPGRSFHFRKGSCDRFMVKSYGIVEVQEGVMPRRDAGEPAHSASNPRTRALGARGRCARGVADVPRGGQFYGRQRTDPPLRAGARTSQLLRDRGYVQGWRLAGRALAILPTTTETDVWQFAAPCGTWPGLGPIAPEHPPLFPTSLAWQNSLEAGYEQGDSIGRP